MKPNLSSQLSGTGVALVTPFTKSGDVDYTALANHVEFVIEGGVDYLVVLGTTGETPVLSLEEKTTIISHCRDINAGRVPIVAGIGGNNTHSVLEEINVLPLEGVSAILSASPYYNKPSQEGIFQHYNAVADLSPVPVLLYNVPGRTGSNITAETTLRLAEHENITGIKEASGNMIQCMHILEKRTPDFLVLSGDDHLTLPLMALGMDGVISVAANCFPNEFSLMVRLCLENAYDDASIAHYKLLRAFDLLFAENNPAGVKAFLSEIGIVENKLRLPLVSVQKGLQKEIRRYINSVKEMDVAGS